MHYFIIKTQSGVADGTIFKFYPFKIWMFTVNVHFQGALGAPDFLASWALILDASHDMALLRMAPHAVLPANELATWYALKTIDH